MTDSNIDPTLYYRTPRINVASGLTLGRKLLRVAPDESSPGILAAVRALRADLEALQAQWKAKQRVRATTDARPFDHRVDRAWAAIERSLERYTILAPSHPDRVRAAQLHAEFFPEGLSFTQLSHEEQHAQSQIRLERMVEEGLREDLVRLVGRAFVHELLQAHRAYGMALGITQTVEAVDEATPVSLVEPLRALGRSISSYTLQLLAFADLDPDRNTKAVRAALAPIDALRRKQARRSATSPEPEPDDLAELELELDDDDDDDDDELAVVDDDTADLVAPVATSA